MCARGSYRQQATKRSVLTKAVEDLKRPEDANNNDNQMDVSPTMKMSVILVEGLIVDEGP